MLIPNHPADERLSALASHDAEATDDAALTAHVSTCDRCTGLIDALGALRLALADLPDLLPSRPLQLIPPVEAERASDRLGGWARRFFAPILATGAALALVGSFGTAAPLLDGMASGPTSGGADDTRALMERAMPEGSAAEAAAERPSTASASEPALDGQGGAESAASEEAAAAPSVAADLGVTGTDEGSGLVDGDSLDAVGQTGATERSPWPMVLFAGVALMIAALLSRWVLAPRTG